MASQEPESQIVDPLFEPDHFIPSTPPAGVRGSNRPVNSNTTLHHGEAPESQVTADLVDSGGSCVEDTQYVLIEKDTQADDHSISSVRHHDSPLHHSSTLNVANEASHLISRPNISDSPVEETQFVSVEHDTQASNATNSLAANRDSQFGEPRNSMAGSGVPQLFLRPNTTGSGDLTNGFTFAPFQPPAKGQFNRPPPPANAQLVSQNLIMETHPKGQPNSNDAILADSIKMEATNSQMPNFATIIHANASSRPMLVQQAPLPHETRAENTVARSSTDECRAQNIAQPEAVSFPIAVAGPQTPVSAASARNMASGSSNKSHKRFKKPFPEVADPQRNGPRHANRSRKLHKGYVESDFSHAGKTFDSISATASANTSQIRSFSPSVDAGNNNPRYQNAAPFPKPAFREFAGTSGLYSSMVTPEQESLLAHSGKRTDALTKDTNLTRSTNEQTTSLKLVHPFDSAITEMRLGSEAHQHSGSLPVMSASHGHPRSPSMSSIQSNVVEQNTFVDNVLEESSKPNHHDIEVESLEGGPPTGPEVADEIEDGNTDNPSLFDRATSRAQSEVPSRPESRRSNCGRPMTRPISPQDLLPRGVLEVVARRRIGSAKIMKSSNTPSNPDLPKAASRSGMFEEEMPRWRAVSKFFEDYHRLVDGESILEMKKEFEQQCQLLAAQKAEIEKLRDTSESAIQQVRELEKEKAGLVDKLKNLSETSSKYKKHMNEVVKAQKYLKTQAIEIQKKTEEAKKDMKAEMDAATKKMIKTRAAAEAVLKKIEEKVEDAKDLRVPAEEFDRVSQKIQRLEAAQLELRKENRKLVNENEFLYKEDKKLRQEGDKLRNKNDDLAQDNNKLCIELSAANQNLKLQEETLGKRMMELSELKHLAEHLENSRDDLKEPPKELVELLKKTPKEVAEELSKEDGFLTKILNLGKATQTKLDEAANFGSTSNNQAAEPSASLIKLIEDLFSRFEASMQASCSDTAAQQESNLKLLDDFKTTVNQLRVDKENELQLNRRIFELGQSNDKLIAEKTAHVRETQSLTNQIDDFKRELADCRDQLSSKATDLAAALAAPREDPHLKARVLDLETANNRVTGQLEAANQERAKLKGELTSTQESGRRKDNQIKNLEQKLNHATSRNRSLEEEKAKLVANYKQDTEKACQEERQRIAKAAETSKASMKMKLESEVGHGERKIKEQAAEMTRLNDRVRNLEEENRKIKEELQTRTDHRDDTTNIQNKFKEQFIKQIAYLKRLEELNHRGESPDGLEDNLQSMRNECTELRNHLDSIQRENKQNIEDVLKGRENLEGNLRQIDALENQNEKLKEQNVDLQKRFDSLSDAYNKQQALHAGQRVGLPSKGGVQYTASGLPQGTLLPGQRTPIVGVSHLGSGSTLTGNRAPEGQQLEDPKDALRKAAKGLGGHRSDPNIANAAPESTMRFANNFETTQTRRQEVLREGSTNSNIIHPDSSTASQTPRLGSSSRPLKVADRKRSNFVPNNGTKAVPLQMNRTETTTKAVRAQRSTNGNSNSAAALNAQFKGSSTSGITPFATFGPDVPTPSPITDLSSMMNELESVPDQEQLQEAYTKARGKKIADDGTIVATKSGLHAFAQSIMDSLKENEHEGDATMKVQGRRNPPSAEEEALWRRTARPSKPAIKMSKEGESISSTVEPQSVATSSRSKISARAAKKPAFQLQNGRQGSYNRAVSGKKPQAPLNSDSLVAKVSPQGTMTVMEHSPNNATAKSRNNRKRSALTNVESHAPAKRIRTSSRQPLPHGHVVPDSQELESF